jgi:hypothetical protein
LEGWRVNSRVLDDDEEQDSPFSRLSERISQDRNRDLVLLSGRPSVSILSESSYQLLSMTKAVYGIGEMVFKEKGVAVERETRRALFDLGRVGYSDE